jgi:hypothetical protein
MPGTDDLQDFLEERLIAYDPDIDLSTGAPAQVEIVEPVVARFEPDPFEVDLPTFIRTRLQQEYPNLNTEDGEALVDFLVKPMEALLDPIIREVTFLRQNKSLANPELLAPAEADALMGNLFVSRTRGTFSVGQVRAYFNAPTAVSISAGNVASTNDGLGFIPTTPQEISAEAMLFNQDGNLFYFDAAFTAEQEGEEYNIEPGEITSISSIPGCVKVTNLSRFRDGTPRENTLELVERGEISLTERSLVVPRGVLARLFDQYSDLQHLQVVGFRDPEMMRDIITGGSLGPIVMYNTDGQTSDDGDGDSISEFFQSPTGGFIANIGAVGTVENFSLTVLDTDYRITEVIADDIIRVAAWETGTPLLLSDSLSGVPFYVRRNLLTISGLPGGVVRREGPNGTTIFETDEVHIGGTTDFYVRGTATEDENFVIEAVSDEEPLYESTDLSTRVTGLPDDVVVGVGSDFVERRVRVGMSLVIETGGDAGSYQIISVAPAGNVTHLQVEPAPSSPATGLDYKVVDTIDVSLNEPKTLRGEGTDLRTVLGVTQVTTLGGVDFAAIGVEEGDILRITGDTPNAGDFQINAVSGTGNVILELSSEMRRTSSSEAWSIFKLGEGILPPVVRVRSVEILDSSQQPTGDTIPYANPIDIQTSSFSNIGIGEKETVNDAVLGILGTVDLNIAPAAVNGKSLKLKINDVLNSIVIFSGVVTAQDIVDQINAAIPSFNIASLVDVGGESRLSLRSRRNWIRVAVAGNANLALGFSVAGYEEDNRQVKSASIPDWSALGLIAGKDSVYEYGKVVFPLTDERSTVRVGSRSFGKVRCYFLEPTSFEVRGSYHRALLSVDSNQPNVVYGDIGVAEEPRSEFLWDVYGDGTAYIRFFPDPALDHQLLPVGEESIPNNLVIDSATPTAVESISEAAEITGVGKYSRNTKVDFLLREVLPGDILEITYHPLQGNVDIRDAPTGAIDYVYTPPATGGDLLGKTLVVSLDNGPDRTVTFTADVTSPSTMVAEINNQLGETIAYEEDTGAEIYLRLEADFPLVLKTSGTANAVLGLTSVVGTNDAPAKGEYVISSVGVVSGSVSNHYKLTLSGPLGAVLPWWSGFSPLESGPSQHFTIRRPGVQRVSSTEMSENQENGLYYADVEVVSFGPGDEFNLDAGIQLQVENHKSDGYWLTTEDRNLTFSEEERINMHIGRRLLLGGATDSPVNMTQVSQQNLQINYDRSALVSQIQAFVNSDLERVLTADILVRHLIPHYVHTQINYEGGSSTAVVLSDLEDLIDAVLPDELLEVSDVANVPQRRGADRVEMPITLIGVVHTIDRTIQAVRSQDAISIGRLATFIPDVIDLVRETS